LYFSSICFRGLFSCISWFKTRIEISYYTPVLLVYLPPFSIWKDGVTALIFASIKGHVDVVKVLLDEGADKEAKDNVSQAPPLSCFFLLQTAHRSVSFLTAESSSTFLVFVFLLFTFLNT